MSAYIIINTRICPQAHSRMSLFAFDIILLGYVRCHEAIIKISPPALNAS